jgi:hypothetical protein
MTWASPKSLLPSGKSQCICVFGLCRVILVFHLLLIFRHPRTLPFNFSMNYTYCAAKSNKCPRHPDTDATMCRCWGFREYTTDQPPQAARHVYVYPSQPQPLPQYQIVRIVSVSALFRISRSDAGSAAALIQEDLAIWSLRR